MSRARCRGSADEAGRGLLEILLFSILINVFPRIYPSDRRETTGLGLKQVEDACRGWLTTFVSSVSPHL